VRGRCITDPGFEDVNNAHERALVFMHKVISNYIYYCKLFILFIKITQYPLIYLDAPNLDGLLFFSG